MNLMSDFSFVVGMDVLSTSSFLTLTPCSINMLKLARGMSDDMSTEAALSASALLSIATVQGETAFVAHVLSVRLKPRNPVSQQNLT